MSIFDKFKKKPSASSENDTFSMFKVMYPQIADLSRVIVDNSYKCGQQLKSQIAEKYGKDSKESRMAGVRVQYEFLFLFSHLTMRLAYSILGTEKARNLQGFFGPLSAYISTESWFGHWPEELKKGLNADFFTNMNIADIEYAKCKENLIKGEPFSDNALFSKLAKNVADIIGHSNEPFTIMNIIKITVDSLCNIKLQELIKNASSDLERR